MRFASSMFPKCHKIVVLGGGSAGFIAALTLKRRLPSLSVQVVRSPDIGIIGVGEGTTQLFPKFFFDYLRLKERQLYAEAQPTWKLGIRFLWGPRPHFHYTFSRMIDGRWPELPKPHGFYVDENFESLDEWSALMERDKAFPRGTDGGPDFRDHASVGFHIENARLVAYLESRCRDFGVEITDATVEHVEKGSAGVQALVLADGRRISADLYLDASGFRSELLGRTFEEPFLSYDRTLFCDRAIIGGWSRTTEPVKSYTTAETMDAGWCWQIEHESWINRGYVYSSRFIDDETARREFLEKNPKVSTEPRIVKFRTGRYQRMWIGNVIGIGNASGFVEPLEASALQVIILQCRTLSDLLSETEFSPRPTTVSLYNRFICQVWDDVRDFLAVHYRFNTRLDTPFWQTARAEVDLCGAAPAVEFYQENGPTALGKTILFDFNNPYGIEGYLAMLIGQKVPHAMKYCPSAMERKIFERQRSLLSADAARGFDVRQTLDAIRKSGWKW